MVVPFAPVGLLDAGGSVGAAADGRPPAAGGWASHLGSVAHLSRSSYALLFNLPGIAVQSAPPVLCASMSRVSGRGAGCAALKTLLIDYGQGAVAAGLPGPSFFSHPSVGAALPCDIIRMAPYSK